MTKIITELVIDGYASGENDFLKRLSQVDAKLSEQFSSNIIAPLVSVMDADSEVAVLTISGHSDRVDTDGLSREQRRAQELQASIDRTDSAFFGVTQMLGEQMSGSPPDDWDEVQKLAFLLRASGAAVLQHTDASLSEDQRRENRRVQFRVVRFVPD